MMFGVARKLLTDARETSYVIFSSLLTEERRYHRATGEQRNSFVFILLQQCTRRHDTLGGSLNAHFRFE